jgi:DNA polymerase-1
MKKLILIDSNALVHRAFHALPPSLTSPKGAMTNAVYGFTSVLLKMLKDLKPDYIAATFDLAGPTFRHEEFAAYKATRTKAPDELYAQIPMIKSLLAAFGIPIFELQGFEADDVIGSLAKQAQEIPDLETVIVTGDLDTLQLIVGTQVTVFTLRKGMTDTVIFDETAVRERYGIAPNQVIDFKGLKGDPSDNIPGVKGVGEKTALSLIQKFGSIESLYANLEKNDSSTDISEKLAEKLIEHKDMAFFSKKLATIICDAPIAFTLPEVDWQSRLDRNALENLMREFGFSSLIKRLPESLNDAISVEQEPISAELVSTSFSPAPNLEKPISTRVALELHDSTVAFSTDATHIHTLSLEATPPNLFSQAPLIIGNDLKRIVPLLPLKAPLFDIKIAAWLLNPDARKYDFEQLSQRYLNRSAPTDPLHHPPLMLELQHALASELAAHKLSDIFEQIEMPLLPILCSMEQRGIAVKLSVIKKLHQSVTQAIARLEKQIYKIAGESFNINSPSQLSTVLFSKLGITGKIKKTGTGALSTAASELEKIRDQHPIVDLITEYRELQKLQTTYIDPFPSLVDTAGRIHTTYNQTGTGTGRLSSQDPNLQNIPTRTELGKEFRRAFIAEKGYTLVSFDYSQIELRIAAHLANDAVMIETFKRGEDIHTRTAAEIFHVKPSEVSKDMRRTAKVLNFGIMYGMGSSGFAAAAGISRAQAKDFIDHYMEEFHGIAAYMEKMKENVRRDGYVETLLGRRRLLPDIFSRIPQLHAQAERMAINHPIQGTEADLIKLAMIRIEEFLKKESLQHDVHMLLQVHDELVFEVRTPTLSMIIPKIRHLMETVHHLSVPLVVDTKIGDNWSIMTSV